jgi:hypothetical protein
MIPEIKLKISLQEMSARGAKIIAQQPDISYEEALHQVQWLKKNSKVSQSLRKDRKGS